MTRVLASGDLVVALCTLEAKVVATGKTFAEIDEPHLWHFDARGRVIKFRHAADTYAQHVACTP